jgi:uncharacterized protein (DUF433 family)
MSAVQLPETTYHLLQQRAAESSRTPDELADELLRHDLAPAHPHIEIVSMRGGPTAVIKHTRVPVSILIGYIQLGETPDTIVDNVLPHLTLAQVHDALSYYYDHQAEIDRERQANSIDVAQQVLRDRLGEDGYRHITGSAA